MFSSPVTSIFNSVCFMEILSHASVKRKTKRLKGFKFCTFMGRFQNNIMAVKGLMSSDSKEHTRDNL